MKGELGIIGRPALRHVAQQLFLQPWAQVVVGQLRRDVNEGRQLAD